MFRTLLIANRGEIACRVIATAHRLGIRTVAVYSEADANARHVRLADDARIIGPAAAAESYLRIDRLIDAARQTEADAIHPGYGFLSENADFAQACADAGIVFVGPTPEAIRAMGSKSVAKDLMRQAGVPVVPDHRGGGQADDAFARHVAELGYPVMLKPALGGGGKGMRRVDDESDLREALAAARREAQAAFGDDEILVEKFVADPRHVEVQVFGDRHGHLVHLFERDCTLQRRHQKIIEEAPAAGLSPSLRAALHDAAVKAARAVDYSNAGTVEFLVSGDSFFFMEMNTRLQVEHPVTEAITGLDLVEWQLRVAAGERLPLDQDEIACRGHAIEARLYAESPDQGFLPSPGLIRILRFPDEVVRIDTGVDGGDIVQPHYDPMIAKIIAVGGDREAARKALLGALNETYVQGPATNRAFLATLLSTDAFRDGTTDIQYVDRAIARLVPDGAAPSLIALAATAVVRRRDNAASDPWCRTDGWRMNAPALRSVAVMVDGSVEEAMLVEASHGTVTLRWQGEEAAIEPGIRPSDDLVSLRVAGQLVNRRVFRDGHAFYVIGGGKVERVDIVDPLRSSHDVEHAAGSVVAPMPGKLSQVFVAAGQIVARGDRLAIVEAMKMEHVLRAPFDGTVEATNANPGAFVEEGYILIELTPEDQ